MGKSHAGTAAGDLAGQYAKKLAGMGGPSRKLYFKQLQEALTQGTIKERTPIIQQLVEQGLRGGSQAQQSAIAAQAKAGASAARSGFAEETLATTRAASQQAVAAIPSQVVSQAALRAPSESLGIMSNVNSLLATGSAAGAAANQAAAANAAQTQQAVGAGVGLIVSILASQYCLHPDTEIDTPSGLRPVRELAVGDWVMSRDASGAEISAQVVETHRQLVPAGHRLVRLGRLVVSPGHPLPHGEAVGTLGGVPTTAAEAGTDATCDIRVDGPTGVYIAHGIPLGSTLDARHALPWHVAQAHRVLATACAVAQRPALCSSFGKDSLALIELAAAYGVRDVIHFADVTDVEAIDAAHRAAIVARYGLRVRTIVPTRGILHFVRHQPYFFTFAVPVAQVLSPIHWNVDAYAPGQPYTCIDERLRATAGDSPVAPPDAPDCLINGFKRVDWGETATCRSPMDVLPADRRRVYLDRYATGVVQLAPGVVGAFPLLGWTHDQVWDYLDARGLVASSAIYDGREKRPHPHRVCYRCHDPHGPALVYCPRERRSLVNLAHFTHDDGLDAMTSLGMLEPIDVGILRYEVR